MSRPPAPDSGRLVLGTWPTPVEPAPRLAVELGMAPGSLWIKRDDLTGLGAGGNKVRKLEFLCAAAVEEGASVLVTSGGPQSNHARLTAAAARRLGLGCVLVLGGRSPVAPAGNLALEALLGAEVVWAGEVDNEGLDRRVQEEAAARRAGGTRLVVLPLGGSNALGARGYLRCGAELSGQLAEVRHVVVALGTGGTMAGLVGSLGAERVLGVDVGATEDVRARVAGILADLRREGAIAGGGTPEHLRVRGDQVGAGYGILTAASRQALLAAARWEGVFLDPVYTAKALSGLEAAIRDGDIGPEEPTVFVHTGGLPGLFGHPAMADALGLGSTVL